MTDDLTAADTLTAQIEQALTDHLLETLEDVREWAREDFHRLMNGRCYKERDRDESFRQQMAAMRHAVMKQITPILAAHERAHAEAIQRLTEERDAARDSADAAIANLQHEARMREQADAEIQRLKEELEVERLRLAACGVAAMQNQTTAEAREQGRLQADSPYRSASYSDVCTAVDREVAHRAERDDLRAEMQRLTAELDSIDQRLARRPALADCDSRAAKVERACAVAGRAEKAEAERDALAAQARALKRERDNDRATFTLIRVTAANEVAEAEARGVAKGRSEMLALVRALRTSPIAHLIGCDADFERSIKGAIYTARCAWCGAEWDEPMPHPANGCLWALAQADAPTEETP